MLPARMRSHNTLIAAMLVRMDAPMHAVRHRIAALSHLRYIDEVIGQHPAQMYMRR